LSPWFFASFRPGFRVLEVGSKVKPFQTFVAIPSVL
jgi:hypothetical protein